MVGKISKGSAEVTVDKFIPKRNDATGRPVYLKRDDRIKAHFLTCFLSLLLYKYLEKKVNRGGQHFTTSEIIGTLRDMNVYVMCR